VSEIDDLRSVVAEDFRFEDRKKVAQVVGGVEEWVRAFDFLWNEAGARARTQLRRMKPASALRQIKSDHTRSRPFCVFEVCASELRARAHAIDQAARACRCAHSFLPSCALPSAGAHLS